jgi:hypothetical protein
VKFAAGSRESDASRLHLAEADPEVDRFEVAVRVAELLGFGKRPEGCLAQQVRPVPLRRALDGVDHLDAARLHTRVELVDVEYARRQVVDMRGPHASDVSGDARDAGELAVPRSVHRLVRHLEGRCRKLEEPACLVRRQPVVLLGLLREGEEFGGEDLPVAEVLLEATLQIDVEEPPVR